MTNGTKSGGLPTWAKVLIGIVAIGILAVVALFIGGVVFVQNSITTGKDPAAMAKTAGKICVLPESLPADYKMVGCFSLAGLNTVSIRHDPDGQQIILMSYPKAGGNAQSVIDRMATNESAVPQQSTHIESVTSKGTETVGGETMPYIVGITTDKATGAKHDAFIGCVVPKAMTKTVFIIGVQPAGSYNVKETEGFLSSIKSFN